MSYYQSSSAAAAAALSSASSDDDDNEEASTSSYPSSDASSTIVPFSEIAKQLILISTLAKDKIISNNGKSFLKELVIQKDPRLKILLDKFVSDKIADHAFLRSIHNVIKGEADKLSDSLFYDTSTDIGKGLSKGERHRKNLEEDKNLIYGEVTFGSFFDILRKLNLSQFRENLRSKRKAPYSNSNSNSSSNGELKSVSDKFVFYDLGSGTGRAVMAARISQDFSKCVGIELLESLHNQAVVINERFDAEYRNYLYEPANSVVEFEQGSFLEFDWSDGDVVFMNSTCFGDELMSSIAEKARSLQPGSIIISFTKPLPGAVYHDELAAKPLTGQAEGGRREPVNNYFEIIEKRRLRMSWGPATVYTHRRLDLDGCSVGKYVFHLLPGDEVDANDDDKSPPKVRESGYIGAGIDDSDDEDSDDDDSDDDTDDYLDDKYDFDHVDFMNKLETADYTDMYASSSSDDDSVSSSSTEDRSPYSKQKSPEVSKQQSNVAVRVASNKPDPLYLDGDLANDASQAKSSSSPAYSSPSRMERKSPVSSPKQSKYNSSNENPSSYMNANVRSPAKAEPVTLEDDSKEYNPWLVAESPKNSPARGSREDFALLNSPQDAALLSRKRNVKRV